MHKVGGTFPFNYFKEEFEDTKGVIRIRISKKNRQHNGQKKKYKRTNSELQKIHIRLNMEHHQPYWKPGMNLGSPEGEAAPAPLLALVVLI
jgi:hypothetical protein